ncbi:MAG: dependent oxidoreductase, partial [Propionibacteriaceae bacterium]|nr:dependent oxidoreductase [Propionibacteriaceae bacterium]
MATRALTERETEVLVVGGGTGGVAAALAAVRSGRRVILTEQYGWLGGQFTSQAVPPGEHRWVEQFGTTRRYRKLREGIRLPDSRAAPRPENRARRRRLSH